jgi:Asp-tRNA(Asn)/Glu-tRNA(Gln) amidotransferase B subunit
MSILERAEADFREKLSGKPNSIEVPEWGENGTPLKVYWKSLINFKSQEKIFALISSGKTSEAVCQTLITRALDEEGNHLFQQNELEKLMRFTDPNVISRIVEAMAPEEETDIDALKKN